MDGIHTFLKKYLDFTPPEKAVARAVAKALKETLDIEISENDISVRAGIAYVPLSGAYKSELIFKKKEVLGIVNKQFAAALTDIR